jgi:copper chaperone
MRCGSCVRHVSTAIRGLDGVTDVDVRLNDGKVLVRHDPTRTSVTHLIAALDRAGYGSQRGVAA